MIETPNDTFGSALKTRMLSDTAATTLLPSCYRSKIIGISVRVAASLTFQLAATTELAPAARNDGTRPMISPSKVTSNLPDSHARSITARAWSGVDRTFAAVRKPSSASATKDLEGLSRANSR